MIPLVFYNKYLKLSSSWKSLNSILSVTYNETRVLRFDGPRRTCSEDENVNKGFDFGNNWKQYLHPKSDAVLHS